MVLQYIVSGLVVKLLTGFDDTMVHIPVVANITKTRKGRIAFAIGIFLAIVAAIVISILFASIIKQIPYHRFLSAGLVFALAILIYFDVLVDKPKIKVKEKIHKIEQRPKVIRISRKRFFKLILVGFLTAFATVIDDTIAYSSLFLRNVGTTFFVVIGILLATVLQAIVLIYFSKKVTKIPWKKEITVVGLLILGVLILAEIL